MMDLKRYQRRVADEMEAYLREVAKERAAGNVRHSAMDAWQNLRLGLYREQQNGLGEDLPQFCLKMPTGGGKTLLATQALGAIYRTILKDRNGAGLVLWIVPSSQIYRDTLKRLSDRRDMYRQMLEHAVSRRIEIWEKHDIARLSPVRLRDNLNILMLQLASTNRETKEQLKFFRDSGGNIVAHFPEERDYAAHRELKLKVPNLEMLVDDATTGQHLIKTSIGNLVKLCRPAVILDEGHKATSQLARATIRNFNASAVVELSATPHREENILSRVAGSELYDEEMIKLPINLATAAQRRWQDVLTQARDRREALAQKAAEYSTTAGPDRLIRPIVLVQVERTGRDQRDSGYVHSQQVLEFLTERLGVSPQAVREKTAENDGLEDVDLMDPLCPVEWIITKRALQEGWDCPFAYVLASLSNTGRAKSMTQLVGRILRQPFQQRTPIPELNESYIYCRHLKSSELAKQVKSALEKEGYEGDLAGFVVQEHQKEEQTGQPVRIRQQFLDLYRRPFEGKIYLPHFCVKNGNDYERLDYFQHLLSQVDVSLFEYGSIDWNLQDELKQAKERFYRIGLGDEGLGPVRETDIERYEPDQTVLGWLAATLPFPYLSLKQARRIVERVYQRLSKTELYLRDHLALVKFVVRDKTQAFVTEQIDQQTQRAFEQLHREGRLVFYLECAECRFEIPKEITLRTTRPLTHDNGRAVAKSLFDYVEHESTNEYERAIALCLDRDANVLWWYRNLVGADHFSIQGYKRHRIRPDFVVQGGTIEAPQNWVLVLESKGAHLEGNPDTTYKRNIAQIFGQIGHKVSWQQLSADFQDHVFRFQVLDEAHAAGRDWQDELKDLLAESV